MIGVCFYFEPKETTGRIGLRWNDLARAFGVDELFCLDRSDDNKFSTLEDVKAAYPNAKFVFVETNAPIEPTSILEYNHPEGDVVYCFGTNGAGFRIPPTKDMGDFIYLPTECPEHSLWAEQAALLVMADRYYK